MIYFKGSTKHDVIHYYYVGWPDHHVVEPRALLELIEQINEHGHSPSFGFNRTANSSSLPPTVIHCR